MPRPYQRSDDQGRYDHQSKPTGGGLDNLPAGTT